MMPEHVQHVLGRGFPPAPIKHVVLLMQENRSFDHYFGTMPNARGFNDRNAIRLPDGSSVFRQPDPAHPNGFIEPWHLDTATNGVQKIPSTSHSWSVQHESLNKGAMDRWLPAHRAVSGPSAPYVMGHYEQADIPFHWSLAQAFTLCDGYHCSVLGPTWPNRMMWMTGTIDPGGSGGGPITRNFTTPSGGYTWKTYPERLEEAGVTWKVYIERDDYALNMLKEFRRYQKAGRNSPLYTKGIATCPVGQFEQDAADNRLPTVSWILPNAAASEHPDYRPADGAKFISDRINAIAANPEGWASTVFVLCYDENDGLFDHVVPPIPEDATTGEFVHGVPIGAGFRVPCIVVSPWTAGGWVATDRFDHTSCLRLLERVTGVIEENLSDWRRQVFGDLTSVLRVAQKPGRPVTFQVDAEVTRANATDLLPAPPTD